MLGALPQSEFSAPFLSLSQHHHCLKIQQEGSWQGSKMKHPGQTKPFGQMEFFWKPFWEPLSGLLAPEFGSWWLNSMQPCPTMTFLLGQNRWLPLPCWDAPCVGMSRTVWWNHEAQSRVYGWEDCACASEYLPGGVLWRRLPLTPDILRRQTLWFMAIYSNILTWKIPWTKEPGRLKSIGLQSQTRQHARTHERSWCAQQVLWGVHLN